MPTSNRHFRNRIDLRKNHSLIPTRYWVLMVMVWLFMTTGTSVYALDGQSLKPGLKALDKNGHMQVSPEDRCPVCGMKVIRHPKFASAIQLQDDTTYYFCGTGCMIRSWLHPEIFLDKAKTKLKQPVVKEYFSGQPIDARKVIFVCGSDVVGPMGPALVPVKDAQSLEVFKQRHGGRTEFLLEELDDAKWFEMTGKKMVK